MAWCSAIKLLSLLSSLSCSSHPLHCLELHLWEISHLCLWACSSSIICSTLCISTSKNLAISGASSAATHWCIKLSWWAWAHWRFCSTLVSVSLKEKDLKTSLWAVILISSSSDAIWNASLGMLPNYVFNISKNDEWMWCEWLHNQVALHNHTYCLIKMTNGWS